jgi:Transposase IS200 like
MPACRGRPRLACGPLPFAGLLKLENGAKSRFFLNDRYLGVFGKQASRVSTNFRQVASIVSEWMPRSLDREAHQRWKAAMAVRRPSYAELTGLCRGVTNLAAVIPDEINRSRLTSQSAANRTACILDAVPVGKDHSFRLLGLPTQCKISMPKTQRFQAYHLFGLRHQIPAQDIRCSAIGGVGGARSVFVKMDCRLLASDGEADHLHILVAYPPKLSVSVLVNALKGTSSRMLRRNRPEIASRIATVFCGRRRLSLRRLAAFRWRSSSAAVCRATEAARFSSP